MHLALDIGGSSVKWATRRSGSSALRVGLPIDLPGNSFLPLAEAIKDLVERIDAEAGPLRSVAISTTGSVDADGVVVRAAHFKDYERVDWGSLISNWSARSMPVRVVNDGIASTWGEYYSTCRAGAGPFSHVHVAVGTGIGSGSVCGGCLAVGDSSFADFLGHVRVAESSSNRCSSGHKGCVEALAAAPALGAAWRDAGGEGGFDGLCSAAGAERQPAMRLLEEAGRWLGIGLAEAIGLLGPQLVTVGGGVGVASGSIQGNPFVKGVSIGIGERHVSARRSTSICQGALGNDAGLVGATLLGSSWATPPGFAESRRTRLARGRERFPTNHRLRLYP